MAGGGWRKCGRLDGDGQPCPGVRADHVVKPIRHKPGPRLCLAHLSPSQLDEVLSRLHPGCEIDVRGTRIDGELLRRILDGVVANGVRTLQDANFTEARFDGEADFGNTVFHGTTRFCGAEFRRAVDFDQARFEGDVADFGAARFRRASFRRARFDARADFSETEFHSDASFNGARFGGALDFHRSRFVAPPTGSASLDLTDAEIKESADLCGVWFHKNAGIDLSGARLSSSDHLGPFRADFLKLDQTVFENSVTIEAVARHFSCRQAKFMAGATLRLRYTRVRLDGAIVTAASSVRGSEPGKDPALDQLVAQHGDEVDLDNGPLAALLRDDQARPGDALWMPALESVQGVDVTELTVSDLDLSRTRFSGAHHLDRMGIEGRSRFAEPHRPHPRRGSFRIRWALPPVWWWTRRQMLAEEAHWRTTQRRGGDWGALLERDDQLVTAGTPEALAAMYRSLRKAQEDNKNGPGASDFYYGEMEMRRHAPSTSSGERAVLFLYWLTSGYGLRAMRALGCLLAVATLVTAAMQHTGFTGSPAGFGQVALYVAWATLSLQAWSAGTDVLTWQGEALLLLMRLTGPFFLGLALLSVRNRVKR